MPDVRSAGRGRSLRDEQQRKEIVRLVTKGRKTAADAARLFGVHPATVSRLLQAGTGQHKAWRTVCQPSRRERTQGRLITYQPNVHERIGKSTLSMDPPRPLVI